MELDNAEVLALLARVAERDERAFARLYAAYARRVYAFVMHRLRDPQAAEEVVSESLYQVWRTPAAFKGESAFATWLLGIARHKLLDRLRASTQEYEDIDEHADDLVSDTPDGFERLAGEQRRAGVAECLAKLAEAHRECLHLVYFEGLSLAEIGSVQGVPENTVKTRLFHARIKIKQCLANLLRREGH